MNNTACRISLLVICIFANSLVVNIALAQTTLSEFPSGKYRLDKSHASIVWKVSHLGLSPYVGRFTDFDFDLNLNTQDLSKSTISATVNPASISTENEKFDKTLIGKSWFNSEKFPTIDFRTLSYEPTSDKTGTLTGELMMFGIVQEVEFAVVINGLIQAHPFISNSVAIGFTATAEIDRSQWEFDKFKNSVGNEVNIEISGEFSKQK